MIVAPRGHGLRGLLGDLALARRLRAARFDLAIDFHGGPRASLLTWLSGAPDRLGYEVAGRGWMYTRRIARPRELRPRHSVENQWDLLAPLGIAPPDRIGVPGGDGAPTPAAGRRVARPPRGCTASQPATELIVIHVSAGNPFRRWPVGTLRRRSLRRSPPPTRGVAIVVTSGPSEADAAGQRDRRRASAGSAPPRAQQVLSCGEFSLAELRALLDRAALYIGGDSGPLHVAATTRSADRRVVRADAAGAVGAVARPRR